MRRVCRQLGPQMCHQQMPWNVHKCSAGTEASFMLKVDNMHWDTSVEDLEAR